VRGRDSAGTQEIPEAEETGTGTQEIPEEEEQGTGTQEIPEAGEIGTTTAGDTQRPTSPEPSATQEKRPGEHTSGGRKKAKAHKPQSHISLTPDDVELVVTTVEERLAEVWENVEKHRASIADQVQEVKTVLEQLRIGAAQAPKETPMQAKEGVPVPETVQFAHRRAPISSSCRR
jgi:hypothetical protein